MASSLAFGFLSSEGDSNRGSSLRPDRNASRDSRGGPGFPHEDRWEEGFGVLSRYVAEHGDALAPAKHIHNGYPLGSWVGNQRNQYDKQKLPKERQRRLEAVKGWSWDPFRDEWRSFFDALRRFSEDAGHCRVSNEERPDGLKLAMWVRGQRSYFRRGLLDQTQRELLESLDGWTWDPFEDQWQAAYAALKAFAKREGHARIPDRYRAGGVNLRTWATHQRVLWREGRISPNREAFLESVPGWDWEPRRQGPQRVTH